MDNEYLLDFSNITTKEDVQEFIYDVLNFPEYYGKNLDALYDCLTDMSKCSITLTGIDVLYDMGDYGKKLIKVFQNAAKDNENICLFVEDTD